VVEYLGSTAQLEQRLIREGIQISLAKKAQFEQ
jgi:hypothetical protein